MVGPGYGQLGRFLDPQDPSNITKACENYISFGSRLPGDLLACHSYVNQTMQEKIEYMLGVESIE
jgi:hypothetical protein